LSVVIEPAGPDDEPLGRVELRWERKRIS